MTETRHHSTYSPFCPGISTRPSIDYSAVASQAVASYPGARTREQALVFALKHTEMQVENAIKHYSAEAHRRDRDAYAAQWVERWLAAQPPATHTGEG